MLVREGLLTPAQHLTAIEHAEESGRHFVTTVIQLGFVSEDRLVELMRTRLVVPLAARSMILAVPVEVLALVPADLARQFLVCPIGEEEDGGLLLLMADASDRHAMDEVAYHTGKRVVRVITTESATRWAIQHYYRVDMGQPQAPWAERDSQEIMLLTKVKVQSSELHSVDPEPEPEVLLLTPGMRRASDLLPAPSPPPAGPKPPPTAPAASAASAVPPLPAGPPQGPKPPPTAPQPAPLRDTEPLAGLGALPSLPDEAPGGATASEQQPRRKRRGTILGVPRVDIRKLRKPEAYTADTSATEPSNVSTKLQSRRVTQALEPRPVPPLAPPGRPSMGLWSSSSDASTPTELASRSEAYASASLALKRARDRDDVGRILCRYFQEYYFNVAFLILKQGAIVGWDAAGTRLTPELIRGVSIPSNGPSTFREVLASRLPRSGRLDETPVDELFQAAIGYRPVYVAIMPVQIREKVVGIVYCDGPHTGMNEDEVNAVLADSETAYERIIVDRRGE